MNNYFMPTQIIEDQDVISKHKEIFVDLGNMPIIVTGKHSAAANGSLQDLCAVLEQIGQAYCIYDKVMSNPRIDCAYDCAAFAREKGADYVIGIGGGSPMDLAKAAALLQRQDIPRTQLFSGSYGTDVPPMVMIPTTAGTGSEVTPYAILTNDQLQTKTSIASRLLFPRYALLDAKYMKTLSRENTVNTAIDAFSHAVEGMLTPRSNEISAVWAKEAIKMLAECLPQLSEPSLIESTSSYPAISLALRRTLLMASTYAGVVIAQTGTTIVHAMGYPLTYFHDIDHGRANGLLLCEVLRRLEKRGVKQISLILKAAKADGIDEMDSQIQRLLGNRERITDEEAKKYAEIVVSTKKNQNTVISFTEEELSDIYMTALQ